MRSNLYENYKMYFNLIYIILLVVLVFFGVLVRVIIFDQVGGDYHTYKEAIIKFHQGINPYKSTLESFELDKSGSYNVEHGYAYLPTLLYLHYFIWRFSNLFSNPLSTVILWKIPTLLSELLSLILIIKIIVEKNLSYNRFRIIFVIVFWLFNPYLMSRYEYNLYDPIFIFFLLLFIYFLNKNIYLSSLFYAISVSLKTIPIILLPLIVVSLFKKKTELIKFLFTGFFYFIVISLPFTNNIENFMYYIRGTIFVHSERFVQGRPILSYIDYLTSDHFVLFNQFENTTLYAFISIVIPAILSVFLYYKYGTDLISTILITFIFYTLFTPVLSRTHILWVYYFFVLYISIHEVNRDLYIKLVIFMLSYLILFYYLLIWNKGLEKNLDINGKPILKQQKEDWRFKRLIKHKYYEYRHKYYYD